jgi:hypothetical protein
VIIPISVVRCLVKQLTEQSQCEPITLEGLGLVLEGLAAEILRAPNAQIHPDTLRCALYAKGITFHFLNGVVVLYVALRWRPLPKKVGRGSTLYPPAEVVEQVRALAAEHQAGTVRRDGEVRGNA